ncbi:MAG TPA: SRPBCC family protein [Chloroflexota bacterium]
MQPEPTDFLEYQCSIAIDASPARAFSIVGDLENTVEWTGGRPVRTIRKTTDGPIGVGTRYRSGEKITMSYGADSEIVEYRPNELIMWRSKPVGERVPYHRWSFQLRPVDGGTLLIHNVRAARARGFMGMVQRLGFLFTHPRTTVPANMDRVLVRIKEMVEQNK